MFAAFGDGICRCEAPQKSSSIEIRQLGGGTGPLPKCPVLRGLERLTSGTHCVSVCVYVAFVYVCGGVCMCHG